MSAEARPDASGLRARAEEVLGRIGRAARRAGRAPEEVTLVAVSKTHPAALVREAAAAGLRDFGENRVQEAEGKIEELKDVPGLRWHLIGHLQPNKVRKAVRLFDVIHSVDNVALVERLERICAEEGRDSLDVLVQVDLAREVTKSGATVDELPEIFGALKDCRRVNCRGLMTLPPFFEDAEHVRPYFSRLRLLRDLWSPRGESERVTLPDDARELSMGMSHDFEVAVEEGATMVRVGTSVFGARGGKV